MEQQTWIIISIIGGALTTLLGWTLKTLYSADTAKIKEMEIELKKIKENYLDRFEKVNVHITKSKEEIMDKLHQMELSSSAKVASQLIETTAKAVALALKNKK